MNGFTHAASAYRHAGAASGDSHAGERVGPPDAVLDEIPAAAPGEIHEAQTPQPEAPDAVSGALPGEALAQVCFRAAGCHFEEECQAGFPVVARWERYAVPGGRCGVPSEAPDTGELVRGAIRCRTVRFCSPAKEQDACCFGGVRHFPEHCGSRVFPVLYLPIRCDKTARCEPDIRAGPLHEEPLQAGTIRQAARSVHYYPKAVEPQACAGDHRLPWHTGNGLSARPEYVASARAWARCGEHSLLHVLVDSERDGFRSGRR